MLCCKKCEISAFDFGQLALGLASEADSISNGLLGFRIDYSTPQLAYEKAVRALELGVKFQLIISAKEVIYTGQIAIAIGQLYLHFSEEYVDEMISFKFDKSETEYSKGMKRYSLCHTPLPDTAYGENECRELISRVVQMVKSMPEEEKIKLLKSIKDG